MENWAVASLMMLASVLPAFVQESGKESTENGVGLLLMTPLTATRRHWSHNP